MWWCHRHHEVLMDKSKKISSEEACNQLLTLLGHLSITLEQLIEIAELNHDAIPSKGTFFSFSSTSASQITMPKKREQLLVNLTLIKEGIEAMNKQLKISAHAFYSNTTSS